MAGHDVAGKPTPTTNPMNPDEFRRQGHMFIDFIADYYANIEQYPVTSKVKPGYLRELLPPSAPFEAEPIEEIMRDVQSHIIPGITHWQHPSHFAYFACTASTAGILGELLSAGLNAQAFGWAASPAATELEMVVMDWFGEMLNLPRTFLFSCGVRSRSNQELKLEPKPSKSANVGGGGGGVIVGTTCDALIIVLVAARDRKLTEIGKDGIGKLVVYCSDQTHCTFEKAAKVVGIQPGNIRAIATTKTTSFALSPDSLESAIRSDVEIGMVPLFLCATVGTTSTTAVDPLEPLCRVAKEHGGGMWVHVDAAYGGGPCICPEFRHVLDGIEGADSISVNAHKWFLTTVDCCCLWVKDSSAIKKSLSTNPEYLKNRASDSGDVVDYKDWQLTLSRRFRSLKLWLVLRSHGVGKLREFVRGHVAMAEAFERLVEGDERFEVVVPRRFSLVCFRMVVVMTSAGNDDDDGGGGNNLMNRKLLERINGSGRVFMTHAVAGGVYMLRFAVGGTLTEPRHVVEAWKMVQEQADAIYPAEHANGCSTPNGIRGVSDQSHAKSNGEMSDSSN
ncbi:unnamed protein product [Linum trigynum]|uniref:Tyrosine decarboxylase n=1 Tax=Linum trigynum TaxID=586398 RepID=A0AAV2FK82_9ROSI